MLGWKTLGIGGVATKKIDVIVISFILTISLFVGLLDTSRTVRAQEDYLPFNVRIASVMETEFSVSWVTPENVSGYIIYGLEPDNLNMTAWDDRGTFINSDTHHVRIGDWEDTDHSYGVKTDEDALTPNMTYYFKIISDGITYGQSLSGDGGVPVINGDPWEVKTPSTSYSDPHFVFGYVFDINGETKVKHALVYCTMTNKSTGVISAPLSQITDTDGGFGFNLSEARYENGSIFQWVHKDELTLFAHAAKEGSGINVTFVKRWVQSWPFQDDDIYLGINQMPTIDISSPPLEGGVADANFTTEWQFSDIDDDAILNLYYDTDTSPGGEINLIVDIGEESFINEFTFDTTGFAEGSAFYLKFEVLDGFNPPVEVYSAPITIDRTPPSAISDLSAQPGENNGEVDLLWTAPGDDGNIGRASEYVIKYSNSMINETNWEDAAEIVNILAPKEPGSSESFTVTNLTTGLLYYFAVKTSDGASLSSISNIASSLPELDLGSPAQIGDLMADTGLETGEIDLVWTATGDDGHLGKASFYTIKYNTSLVSNANWNFSNEVENPPVPKVNGLGEMFTVTNLTPEESYFFAIKAFDEGLNPSEISNVAYAVAMLDTTPPLAINDLKAKTGDKNGEVILTWTAPGDDDNQGATKEYILRYATYKITDATWNDATTYENFILPDIAGTPQNFTVEGLNPGVKYYFAIKSMDEAPNLSPVSNSPSAKSYSDATFLVIDSPRENEAYLTTDIIVFDASNSTDADDNLSFFWTSNIDGRLGEVAWIASNLSVGSHMITLFVTDEKGNLVSGRVNITVIFPSNQGNGTSGNDTESQTTTLSNACLLSIFLLLSVMVVALYDVLLFTRYRKAKVRKEKTD